jgi:hypothetical protein
MSFVKLNWRPGKRELRQFGAVFLTGFVVIGGLKYLWPWEWLITRDEGLGSILITIGVVVGLIGLTGHKIALPFYWTWLGTAYVLGNITSRIIVGAIFFLVVTPIGFLSRLVGRDRLWLKKPERTSYWQKISLPAATEQYERQF